LLRRYGGREGLICFTKTLPRPANDKIGPEMKAPPAYIVAEGELVTFIFKQNRTDSKDKAKTCEAFTYDMFRIKNGKIVEHWDGAVR
jgi:predicted SnoaL-like aldol condensation-catalyzing enzyme